MTKLKYLLAAVASLAIASPTFAQDGSKAGLATTQGAAQQGEVRRDEGRSSQEGRGEMRRSGDRDQGRMEVRGERRDGDRVEMRGERRMRPSMRVELGERDRYRGERRWHRAHAERMIVVHRRHRHHRHYD